MSDYVPMDLPTLGAQQKMQWFDFGKDRRILNLGCGPDYETSAGWVNLDGDPNVKADVHHDIEITPLPFEDDSFDTIFASHILEHVHNLVPLQAEFNRILKRPTGKAHILVPHFTSPDAWGDPTHCRAFSNHSLYPCYWKGCTRVDYNIVPVRMAEGPAGDWIVATLFYGEE